MLPHQMQEMFSDHEIYQSRIRNSLGKLLRVLVAISPFESPDRRKARSWLQFHACVVEQTKKDFRVLALDPYSTRNSLAVLGAYSKVEVWAFLSLESGLELVGECLVPVLVLVLGIVRGWTILVAFLLVPPHSLLYLQQAVV